MGHFPTSLANIALAGACLVAGPTLWAQPTCAINIGPDTTICQGSSVTLHAPAGFGNRLWSTGATTTAITVATAGDYWCQVTYPSGNLVTNGDFSAGNTGFSSQFTYSLTSVQNEGMYTVGPNSNWYHNQFHGTGNGNFLIANGGWVSWSNGQTDVWCQTIPCCPGQTYTLSYRAQTLSNALPARAVWKMDGVLAQWPDFTFPAYGTGWQQFTTTWTAGPGQTSVNACISLTSADGIGDDLGIDDINISGTIVLRDTIHVGVTPLPVVALGPDRSLCAGDAIDMDVTQPGATYLWQDGSGAPTRHITTGGSYSVSVTAQGCTASDQVNITLQPLPVVHLGPDTVLCTGSTLNLSAAGTGYSQLWQDGSTAATFQVVGPGLYWAQASLNNCVARDSILVGYNPTPVVNLGNDTTLCAGQSLLLNATVPGASYTWQDGTHNATLSAASAGNYHVQVSLYGCTSADSMHLAMVPLPPVFIGPDTTVCPGIAVTFNASTPGGTYSWSDGSSGPILTTAIPGLYMVEVTLNGCAARDTARLSNFNLQTVNLGPDRAICAGASTLLGTHVPGASYAWSTGAASDSISVANAGNYWVDITLNGCTVRDTVAISIIPLPVVSLGPDLHVCPGGQATLNATLPGASYLWSNGATGPAIQAGAGNWSVTVNQSGCTATDAISISEWPSPLVDLGPDTLLCPGGSITLNAGNPGASFQWNTGATAQTVTFTQASTASVTITDAHGCLASDSVIIGLAILPALSLGPDLSFCSGAQFTLNGQIPGASAYTWSDGSTAPVLTSSTGGTYWVAATVGYCTVRDTIIVSPVPSPIISLGNDTTLCPGETLLLSVPGAGLTISWQDGSIGNQYVVGGTGDYWAIATNSAGCSGTAQLHADFLAPGILDLGPDTFLCAGASIQLHAGLPGGITQWTGSIYAQGPSVNITSAGHYIATTTVGGCSISDSISIALVAPPVINLGPDLQLCSGRTLLLHAGTSVLWDDGSADTIRTVAHGGLYWAVATSNGCSASDTVLVTEVPLPTIHLGHDTALCAGSELFLDATAPGATYLWNDGVTAAQRHVQAGLWSVRVEALGCASTDSIHVAAIALPTLGLPGDTTLCAGEAWMASVAQPGCSYIWSTGDSTGTITINAPGNYGVTIDRAGCVQTGHVTVQQVDLSQFSLGTDTIICPGAALPVAIAIPNATVLWQDGTTDLHRLITSEGTYTATVDVGGCAAAASLHVGVTPVPVVDLGPDQVRCQGDTVRLSVDPGPAVLTWNIGNPGNTWPVTASGLYIARLTLDGCSNSDSIHILFRPVVKVIDLGPDQGICPGMAVVLDATIPGASITWNDGTHAPSRVADKPGTWWVVAEGPCIHAADTITLWEGVCAPIINIPNAFTPDGDGINDLFTPSVEGLVQDWSFMIFDRWGERLFSSNLPGQGWDGLVHGIEAPVGVYVWSLRYRASTDRGVVQESHMGSVTLVR